MVITRRTKLPVRVHQDTTNLHPTSLHPNDLEEIRQPPMPADYSIPQLQNISPSGSTPAGRLVQFLPNRKKLTSDRLVLQIVKGYIIPLKCVPHQWRPRFTKGSSIERTNKIA